MFESGLPIGKEVAFEHLFYFKFNNINGFLRLSFRESYN
ncbi:hypothetical protein PANNVG_03066 [Pantoea sp. Nvir]